MGATTFAGLGVSQATSTALRAQGFESPFAVQELVLPDGLAGRDLLVRSPTGSGKTLGFGIPMLERLEATDPRPSALVLAPTRELATQITEALLPLAHARALAVAAVFGGVGFGPQEQRARKAHVVVACPGRLEDLIARGTIQLDRVKVLVLDEADRMLDMGFKPAVDRLVRQTPRERQTMLFSATLDERVQQLAKAYLREPAHHEHGSPQPRTEDVDHRFVRLAHEGKVGQLVRELRDRDRGRTLVFVRTKRGADRLVKKLGRDGGIEAVAMHGDKTQGQRERALAAFEAGRVDVLVATDVAARGIDVRDVTHVVNFDAPADRETYVHRVGRTARAGASGIGITFVLEDQMGDVRAIAAELGLQEQLRAASGGGRTATAPREDRPAKPREDRSAKPREARPAKPRGATPREERPAKERGPRSATKPREDRAPRGAKPADRLSHGGAPDRGTDGKPAHGAKPRRRRRGGGAGRPAR